MAPKWSISILLCIIMSTVAAETTQAGLEAISALWKESLNTTADPCDDFYEFACGGWVSNNPIPKDKAYYDRYQKLSDEINRQTKALYNSNAPTNSSAIRKLKMFYNACMDMTGTNTKKTEELLHYIEKIGYWPIIHGDKKFEAKAFDLTDYLIRMAEIRGMDVFFAAYGNIDLNNVSRTLIHFERGSLGMQIPQFYLDTKRFKRQIGAYEHYIRTVVGLIMKDSRLRRTRREINDDVKDIIHFEQLFAHATLETMTVNHNFSDVMHAKRLSDLSRLIPSIDWKRYFLSVMPEKVKPYIHSNPEVIIANPRFFVALNKLLQNTSPRTLANVMLWRFADAWWLQLDERFELVRHDYMRRIIGTVSKAPRWKECSVVTGLAMSYASDAMYVADNYNQKSTAKVQRMFEELRAQFMGMLKNSEWMDPVTRDYALTKAQQMIALIGAQDLVYNLTALDDHYEGLEFDENDSYGTMVRKHSVWKQKQGAQELLEPVDRFRLSMGATQVNAAYTFVKNALTISSAILQPPFFGADFPKATNYGAIGSIISHEIVHGFDQQGRQFDKIGNKLNWWDPQTQQRFLKRTDCMIGQYSAYHVEGTGMNVDGFSTQGENMADNGGIKQAYRAYHSYLERLGHAEPRIPGFEEYDNDQMFFISFATSYCGHAKPEEAMRQLYADSHSPSRHRINGVVSNRPEFAKAFKCHKDARLNPVQRCSVW